MRTVVRNTFIFKRLKNERSDDQLFHAYARGQEKAFDLLYAKYKQAIYNYLYRNCDSEVLDELFQEVWIRVVASSKRYQSNNKFRSWLFTLAHNCLVDHYRRQSKRFQMEAVEVNIENQIASGALIENLVASEQVKQQLALVLSHLPMEQREAFYLREESGFSIKDIAGIQGIAPEAAKSRLRYAYEKLRLQLQEHST